MTTKESLVLTLLSVIAWPLSAWAQEIPGAPYNIQAGAVANTQSIVISWQASPTPGVSYRLYRSTSSGTNGTVIANNFSGLSFTDADIIFGNTYYYRVAATLSDAESSLSTQISAKAELPVPTNIRATDTFQGGEIKISWDRPTLNLALKYIVFRSTVANSQGSALSSSFDGTEYLDKTAINKTSYYYQVASVYNYTLQSYTSSAQSALSTAVSAVATDATSPEKVGNLSASASSDNKASLSWSTPKNEQTVDYFVYRSSSPSGLGSQITKTTSTYYSDTLPSPLGTFFYRIVARDASGNESVPSDAAVIQPAAASAAAKTQYKVSDLAAEGTLNRGEIQLRWKLPSYSEITHARIYRRLAGNTAAAMIADKVYGASYLDKTVLSDKNYYYTVRLVDKSGYEYEAPLEKNATSFTEKSKSTPVDQNKSTPAPAAKKSPPASASTYAYGRARMANLKLEASLANDLRRFLIQKLGAKKVPRRISPVLIRAYIYGGYVVDEIADTMVNGPGKVHPTIHAVIWRKSAEYMKNK